MNDSDLDNLLQVGKSIRVYYKEGNIHNEVRHIRAIVDDDWIVYRVWSRTKQRWVYRIDTRYSFSLICDYLEEVK